MRAGLVVHNSVYDPKLKPIQGYLNISYNGAEIEIKVSGPDVHCCVKTHECNFCIGYDLTEPGSMAWENIIHGILKDTIYKLTCTAINQVVYLRGTGDYREH